LAHPFDHREFREITAEVDALLEDPKQARALGAAREALTEADREYAMGLGALRQALGLTQVELARRLQVTRHLVVSFPEKVSAKVGR